MKIDNLPYYIGPSDSDSNPDGLPSTWPFSFGYDPELKMLRQHTNPALQELLERTYRCGRLIGTPLADDSFGKPYADDFLETLNEFLPANGKRSLEIGAGVGYLTRRMGDLGWKSTGIEPGKGYSDYWTRYQVDIVNEFFPSSKAVGPYDLVMGYLVLEHISDPVEFLKNVRSHLSPNGLAAFAVPDCTEEISAGDPAILVHEHFSFFDDESMATVFRKAGLSASIRRSKYGRCLYAFATPNEDIIDVLSSNQEVLKSYPSRATQFAQKVKLSLALLRERGTLGIYCPGRGLAVLDPNCDARWFDDDPALHGKYFPPFTTSIESRQSLLAKPVNNLVIMSRTFGRRISESLKESSYQGNVVLVNDLTIVD